MFLALSDLRMSLEGGEPTATTRGAAGAARAAEAVPSPARTPAAMPQGAAATSPSGFASGRLQLESAIEKRRWPDGKREVSTTHYAAYSKLRILRVFCVFTQCPWGALRIAYCVLRMVV